MDNDNNAWLVQKNGPINIDLFQLNEMDWQTWYKKTDNNAFDFLQGPLIKFCVIVGEHTEIIILGHHIIGDGIGYLNLVKDILLALDNRIDIIPQLVPQKREDLYFKDTILLDAGVKSFAFGLNEEWKQNRANFSEKEYLEFFEQYRSKYVPNLYMASIEGDSLKKLLVKGKSNGLTVNETISSAFSLAAMEILNKDEIRLGIAANIRNELVSEPNNCMGNFVTGISTMAHYDRAKDFMSNAKTIAGLTNEQLSNVKNRHLAVHFLNEFEKDLIESTLFAAYGLFEHPASKKLAELMGERSKNKGLGISNLGRYDFKNYNTIRIIDIQFIGPAFPANLLTVGAITINNKLNLCLRYNEGETGMKTIEKIYEKAIELMI
jgi:NRPS condensation-like uncharacterized protein